MPTQYSRTTIEKKAFKPCLSANPVSKLLVYLILFLSGACNVSANQGSMAEAVLATEYSHLEVHLGFENAVSAERLNYPLYILLSGQDWKVYNEQFRQLGLLVDLWDQARRNEILLEETRNVPMQGIEKKAFFQRQVRIIRTNWNEVGEKCGYRSGRTPHSGCSFNKRLPRCTIVVPHQQLYANGDINEYHQLLGHEMWHCLVGSFH